MSAQSSHNGHPDLTPSPSIAHQPTPVMGHRHVAHPVPGFVLPPAPGSGVPHTQHLPHALHTQHLPHAPHAQHLHHAPYPPPVPFYPPNPVHTLPTLTHIPLLTGRLDFASWDSRIRSILRSLGLIGHISSTGDPIDPLRPETLPLYPPRLTHGYNQADLVSYCQWWDRDAVVDHIVTTRLSTLVPASLPPDNMLQTHTARTIYDDLQRLYGLRGLSDGLTVFNALMALPCHPHCIQEFVIKWRAGVSRLLACQYPVSSRLMIQQFVSRLPADAPAFYSLRAGLVSWLQAINDTDFNAFVSLSQEVIDLDNTFRQSAPSCSTDNRDRNNRGQPSCPKNTGQLQQPQQPRAPNPTQHSAASSTIQSRDQPLINANHSCDNGRPNGRHADNQNRDQYNNNQALLATILSDPAQSSPDSTALDSSPSLTPSLDPLAFLSSSELTPIVNEDVQADFYDPLGPMACVALSSELSNALALISISTGPKAKLNTILDSGSTHHIFRDRSVFHSYDAQDVSVKTYQLRRRTVGL